MSSFSSGASVAPRSHVFGPAAILLPVVGSQGLRDRRVFQ